MLIIVLVPWLSLRFWISMFPAADIRYALEIPRHAEVASRKNGYHRVDIAGTCEGYPTYHTNLLTGFGNNRHRHWTLLMPMARVNSTASTEISNFGLGPKKTSLNDFKYIQDWASFAGVWRRRTLDRCYGPRVSRFSNCSNNGKN